MIEEDTEGQILVSIHVHTYKHLHITYKHTHTETEAVTDITNTLGGMGQADQHTLVQAGLEFCVLLRVTPSF